MRYALLAATMALMSLAACGGESPAGYTMTNEKGDEEVDIVVARLGADYPGYPIWLIHRDDSGFVVEKHMLEDGFDAELNGAWVVDNVPLKMDTCYTLVVGNSKDAASERDGWLCKRFKTNSLCKSGDDFYSYFDCEMPIANPVDKCDESGDFCIE